MIKIYNEQWQPKLKHIGNMFTYTNNTPKFQVHIINNMVEIIPIPSLLVHVSHVPISCFVYMHTTYFVCLSCHPKMLNYCNVLSDITSFFFPLMVGLLCHQPKFFLVLLKSKAYFLYTHLDNNPSNQEM